MGSVRVVTQRLRPVVSHADNYTQTLYVMSKIQFRSPPRGVPILRVSEETVCRYFGPVRSKNDSDF